MTEEMYAYMLHSVPGLGNKSLFRLYREFGSCKDIYDANPKDLKKIINTRQVQAFQRIRDMWDVERDYEYIYKTGIDFAFCGSEKYPEKLKKIPDPPFALYSIGELPDERKPAVSIIGARNNSEYGRYAAKVFGEKLARCGVQIISGMARGIDGIGQQAAIEAGGSTFGVLGNGVDVCYPGENKYLYDAIKVSGGLISEYPLGVQPKPQYFPPRNRIISGLSDVVLVIEARQKSGTFITVDMALEQGKDVFALPGRINDSLSEGCNYLIKQGANIATSPDDIIEYLRCDLKKSVTEDDPSTEKCAIAQNEAAFAQLSDTQKLVFEVLDFYPIATAGICEKLMQKGYEISVSEVMNVLVELCIAGVAARNSAGFYRKW